MTAAPSWKKSWPPPGKEKMLEECLGISNLANIFFVRQKQTLGLGHAVSMAKAFTGDDPFVVIYGDDVISGARTLSAPSSSAPMRSSAARLPVSPLCPGPM